MKNFTFKSILFIVFVLCSLYITAQGALPSDGVFRLKNVGTGQFLTDAGASATPVTMTNLAEEDQSTHWKFVASNTFYNIDSEVGGILRAPGNPFLVLSTGTTTSSSDKIWTIVHNAIDDTYRFQSGTSSRYMYHETDGTVTHIPVAATDNRSNWELVPYIQTPAEIAPDEDTSTDLTCPSSGEFENNNTRNVDIPNADNVGTADDRTCYADYSESTVYGKTWGVYNITDGSNHWDAPNTLQPRIERSLPRSGETGVGSFARFTGVVRILEVGDGGSFGQNGSYLAQAKGKHTGGGGPNDPAICLYRAHPVYGEGINADKQVAFDIYAERILERGGSGSGREVVFLKRVNKNEEVSFELEVGFRADPNDSTKKIHYCDAVIGGDAFNFNIPDPERGLESGIRYGVYRVRGGRAQMRWANTTYQRSEVPDTGAPIPSDDIYRLRNVATGQFLTAVGSSATPVIMTDSGDAQNTHWTFEESGVYFNIDSETAGILRAPGAGFSGGAYRVVTTGAESSSDSDKTWTIEYDDVQDTYRFESRTAGRYLYQETDGTVTHSIAPESDTRSVWEAIPTSVTLSNSDLAISETSLKIYPNPSEGIFTITLPNVSGVKNIEIYSILGKLVYQDTLNGQSLEVKHADLNTGVYLVNVSTEDNKVLRSKLVVK